MITEDYVSFETAKLLKEKGFDIGGYASIKVFGGRTYEVNGEWITPKEDTIIPTLQMAMKWLREVKNLLITVHYSSLLYGTAPFYWDIEKMECNRRASLSVATSTAMRDYTYRTYEEACEGAIKYCLKSLI